MDKIFLYGKTLESYGIAYLGNVAQSAKMQYSYNNGTMTYCVYLAPADMSGYNVCPNSQYCKAFCLNGSGHNKAAQLQQVDMGGDVYDSFVNRSRIKKTKMFHEDKATFMHLLIHEPRPKPTAHHTRIQRPRKIIFLRFSILGTLRIP